MNVLVKIYSFVKVCQDVIQVALPILEVLIKKDLNGDGRVGNGDVK